MVLRRGRRKTVCTRGACRAAAGGPSTSPLDAMFRGDLSTFGIVALVVGSYVLLAVFFLRTGALLKRHYPRVAGSRFSATVHVLALFAFLLGCLLAWMAYASDHPMKERHLFLPIVLPLCVYGYVLFAWVRYFGVGEVLRAISTLFSRKDT